MKLKLIDVVGSGVEKQQSGFALVIALSLMAFVLVLLVSISAFVRVETALSSNNVTLLEARQNALLALNEALGELQKHAGADQRVTATAEISEALIASNGATIEFTEIANPYFTQVWNVSGAQGQAPGTMPGHNSLWKPAVLVSGNAQKGFDSASDEVYPSGYVSGDTALDPGDADVVTLIDLDSYDGGDSLQIRVPRVSIDSNTSASSGSYAWWVGDENVKARLNLNEPVDATLHEDAVWLAPQHYSPQTTELFESVLPDQLAQISSFSEIVINALPAFTGESYSLTTDYSLVSNSLFTDVRNGGLKKDLTFGLDGSNTQPTGIEDADFLFARDLGGAPAERSPNLNFIQWGVMRDFYNTRIGDEVVDTRSHRKPDTSGSVDYRMGIKPVITHFQVGIYADYVDNEIRFVYYPVLVLWNPYRFDIRIPELHLTFKEDRGNNDIEIKSIDVRDDPAVDNEEFKINSMPFTIASTTISAGRAVIFSPADGIAEFSPDNGSGTGIYGDSNWFNYLLPGYRHGAGFYQLSGLEKSETPPGDPLPDIKFALNSNGRLYLDLHERLQGAHNSRSNQDFYQLVTGMLANEALGTASVQYYQPIVDGFPEPKFLFVFSMPFAETNFFTSYQAPRQWVGLFNPRATVIASDVIGMGYTNSLSNYVGGFLADSDAEANSAIQTADAMHGFVGTSPNYGGSDQAILYDLPREAPHSLAQFAHVNLTAPPVYTNSVTHDLADPFDSRPTSWAGEFMMPLRLSFTGTGDDFTPAYTVGTSRASPYIPLEASGADQTRFWRFFDVNSKTDAKMVWDFPYLVNEVLFDQYYFSTVPQSGALPDTFRNPLVKSIDGTAADVNELRSFERSAAGLYLKGGFNVNSTSVAAWSALLAAFRAQPYDDLNGDGSLFARFYKPVGKELGSSDLGPFEAGSVYGFRRLSDEQIEDLATRIVEQVKLRGPFPSMSAFVNRVMYSEALYRKNLTGENAPDPHSFRSSSYDLEEMVMRQGALSAALELSIANENFYDSSAVIDSSSGIDGSSSEVSGFVGSVGADLPGYLSQVDLLSTLGSQMTVRSDTFTIIVYASVNNKLTGDPEAEVYCEAIVQRKPEFVDSFDNDSWDDLSDLTVSNEKFGRKFEVVSLRWLNKEDLVN
ncbi:hypothetical protein QEH59_00160 [Coraliomargarita sp. SDUM461004]|uniref:Flp pilus-assembly TadG-like N-terminal domain-containing protein n=1 Tax=Thalassobacterium sedimentorum TaxID=3041258 RepID=A0ABU1ADN9_9BACT|nr:hypothetical protein [Coraliomargarita sp. SDUM461004]MDQ8192815.1 hypothetical protein [Coraliomargarita sp. SDUM461004]